MNKNRDLSLSHTDKLCLVALAGILITTTLIYDLTDGQTIRAAEEDTRTAEPAVSQTIDYMPLVEAAEALMEDPEAAQADLYDESIPLSRELQAALREACEEHGVPLCLMLGLIEVESDFQVDTDNGISTGLMQTNTKYASTFEQNTGYSVYTPEGNIRNGVWYLSTLIDRYNGNQVAALVAYNQGNYRGVVTDYAKNVIRASEKWDVG